MNGIWIISRLSHYFAAALVMSVLAFLILLGGCSDLFEPSSKDSQPMRIGSNVWPGYEPLYLARELGYYEGLPVSMVEYPSASEVLRAYRNGVIQAAALTMDEVLMLADSGFDLRVVLLLDVSLGGDVILAQGDIQSMAGLKGKRVGVENTALGAYMLSRALAMHGMVAHDVTLVSLEVNEHESAFKTGHVDAVVTFEPVRTRLLEVGAKLLFSSQDIPDEIFDVLVVDGEYLAQNRKVVASLVQRWFQTLEYQRQNPQRAAEIIARRQQLTPGDYLASMNGLKMVSHAENIQALGGLSPPIIEVMERLKNNMLQNQLLQKTVDVEGLVDGGLL
ncbi:MAG: nitrate ABC transporter [Thiotrichales bacterium]|nr:MAG: nitrate ABC transporter [Thiotrichales bacterium]